MEESDLKEIGINAYGPKIELLRIIQQWKKESNNVSIRTLQIFKINIV